MANSPKKNLQRGDIVVITSQVHDYDLQEVVAVPGQLAEVLFVEGGFVEVLTDCLEGGKVQANVPIKHIHPKGSEEARELLMQFHTDQMEALRAVAQEVLEALDFHKAELSKLTH